MSNLIESDVLGDNEIVAAVRHWVETLVVGLNLCPFAKRELVKDRVRFFVIGSTTEEQLLLGLRDELELLHGDSSIETTLLIHPNVLQDFHDYNQFLFYIDNLLKQMDIEGVFQVASFHPDYQFAGTQPDDVENYTNKSPYPMLHLIREESLEKAIENYPDSDLIPDNNIELLNSLGHTKMERMLQACFEQNRYRKKDR